MSSFPVLVLSLLLLASCRLEMLAGAAEIVVRKVEFPCSDRSAIQWVRDPANCAQYYICHFGQPLAMPACPFGQVWGIRARNCVPEDSRWNDCNTTAEAPKDVSRPPRQNDFEGEKKTKQSFYALTVSSPSNIVVSFEPLSSTMMTTARASLPPGPSSPHITRSPAVTTPQLTQNYSVYEKSSKPKKLVYEEDRPTPSLRQDKLEPVNRTASPTVASPFQPWSTRSYYTLVSLKTLPPGVPDITQRGTSAPTRYSTVAAPSLPTMQASTSTAATETTSSSPRPVTSAETTSTTTPTSRPSSTARDDEETARTSLGSRRPTFPPVSTASPDDWAVKPMQQRLPEDHPCHASPGKLVAHNASCNWYYNCSLAALENMGGLLETLEEECRYPQLFDTVTERCREFINVQCGDRFEPVDPCEYRNLQCQSANCLPCQNRFGSCRGKDNGIYPFHTQRWTPTFVTCYQQRNIAQDDCQPPTPIFSPEVLDCVTLFDVPKNRGGLRPECSWREDGIYPDEQGRCGIFFECRGGEFLGYDECPSGTSFDPLTLRCQLLDRATPPCGEGQDPSCADRHDGFHADPFGRCPYYFECRKQQFVRHLTCDYGSFDPVTQECVIPAELLPRPCGLLPNPCQGKPSGFYPDEASRCRHYMECSRGILVGNATCPHGTVFSSISGRCDRPENAPAPCGMAPSCEKRADGRYPALTRGCSFYFECRAERFVGLRQCSFEDGGFFFNERTAKCDFPQNICPPCGYRWWGCAKKSLNR